MTVVCRSGRCIPRYRIVPSVFDAYGTGPYRKGQRSHSTATATSQQVIFSGIQPTGVPHLGNYLGALRQWVALQNSAAPSAKLFFSVVDLHAITIPLETGRLRSWKRETLATLLAIGLDPERSTIFYQSSASNTALLCYSISNCKNQVPAHSELMWILSCTASMGYLSRMTQWKVWIRKWEIWDLLNILRVNYRFQITPLL